MFRSVGAFAAEPKLAAKNFHLWLGTGGAERVTYENRGRVIPFAAIASTWQRSPNVDL